MSTSNKDLPKCKRKSITLQTKKEIISLKDKGMTASEIMKRFELSSSTLATIYTVLVINIGVGGLVTALRLA